MKGKCVKSNRVCKVLNKRKANVTEVGKCFTNYEAEPMGKKRKQGKEFHTSFYSMNSRRGFIAVFFGELLFFSIVKILFQLCF